MKITGREKAFEGDALCQMLSGNNFINFAHEGHVVYLAGPPGSMKTTIMKHIAAAGAGNCTPLGFKTNLDGRRVIWFDGEQPEDVLIKAVHDIIEMSGGQTEFFDVHSLVDLGDYAKKPKFNSRPYNFIRKEKMFDELFSYNVYSNVGMIFLDAGSHFITDINDFREAEQFAGELMRYAKRFKCVIFVLSHVSQSNGIFKLFGSWGTKLKERASCGFDTERRGPYFGLRQTKLRIGDPLVPRWFTYDGKELMEEPFHVI